MKKCGKCGDEKPLEDFYVDRRAKDGHVYACKPCIKAANAASNARVPIEVKRERWRRQNKTDYARAAWKRYYERNRDKYKQWSDAWYEANPGRRAELWDAWYTENREAVLAKNRANYDAEKKRATRNPEQGVRDTAKRRARLAGVEYEPINRAKLYARDQGTCQICRKPAPEKGWEMDHIVPLVLGGPHLWSNVQVTHRTCNRRKSARLEGQIALPA
jgi:5-methylcytosine-specific restriction endonuclease McrA